MQSVNNGIDQPAIRRAINRAIRETVSQYADQDRASPDSSADSVVCEVAAYLEAMDSDSWKPVRVYEGGRVWYGVAMAMPGLCSYPFNGAVIVADTGTAWIEYRDGAERFMAKALVVAGVWDK